MSEPWETSGVGTDIKQHPVEAFPTELPSWLGTPAAV